MNVEKKTGKQCGITREHEVALYQNYIWLAEFGEQYKRDAELARDTYCFVQNILDIEEGIEQGYLTTGG